MKNRNPTRHGRAVPPDAQPLRPPDRQTPIFEGSTEELEQRLEAAFASLGECGDMEPCVWACACFLRHLSEDPDVT